MINFDAKFLLHDGGTKFYEVVRFSRRDRAKACVVKRWGKNSAVFGGGECKIESNVASAVDRVASITISSKLKRGYSEAFPPTRFGLYQTVEHVDDAVLRSVLAEHYKDNHIVDMICSQMTDEATSEESISEIIIEEPPLAMERGMEWGSW
jgi:predicted DNA-binding WGR domain protein